MLSVSCSIKDLKKKKESLMATFRPLYNKVCESRRSNLILSEEYRPKWFAYDAMERFLEGVYQPKTAVNKEEESFPVDVYQPNGDFDDGYSGSVDVESVKGIFDEHGADTFSGAETLTPSASYFSTQGQKRKLEMTSEFEECTSDSYDGIRGVNEDNNEDYCFLYGQLVARKLRRLDERTREIVMNDIDNLIFRATMNGRGSQNTFEHSPNTYFPESHTVSQGLNLLYVNQDSTE
ncbi:hypothetical protein L9F63_015790 [Diploptera punctata]|uniref:MADF domain-containing protein n=1 Tax=Diploptera punctata TaxID=6984 RepID=A0AAD8EJ60_DIPPU|nr:hypothetical protein L9F63_015790 [Diploptera punctata]